MVRSLLFCVACLPALSMAQTLPDNFNQEIFERRFRAADKDGDGRLSRSEAHAEFPRAPTFFDEIDDNGDKHITLLEFNQAMDRRAAAALEAGSRGGTAKYVKQEYLKGAPPAGGEAGARDMASSIAQRRSHEFDEFLGSAQDHEPYPDLPVVNNASNLVKKSY
jgi:EF hand